MTQKEIARQLKITQATVSMALAGSPRISPAVREAVRELAERDGYRPNPAGQLLRGGKSNVIGVLFPSLTNPFYAELFQELQLRLREHGYLPQHFQQETAEWRQSAILALTRFQAAGAIVAGLPPEEHRLLREAGIRFVVYGGDQPFEGVSQVLPDRRSGTSLLMRHLIAGGRRRIAFLGPGGPEEPRRAACREALEQAGLPVLFQTIPADPESGRLAIRELLAGATPPDAVFAHNDELATGVLRGALEMGVRIPQELAVAGFDNIAAGRFLTPSLTTVEQPRPLIVEALVVELLSVLRGSEGPRHISVPCRLVTRDSA